MLPRQRHFYAGGVSGQGASPADCNSRRGGWRRLPSAACPISKAPSSRIMRGRSPFKQAAQAGIVQMGEDDFRLGVQHISL